MYRKDHQATQLSEPKVNLSSYLYWVQIKSKYQIAE